MNAKKTTLTLLVIACALSMATSAVAQAQQNNPTWHGQDSEFGTIRTPFAAEMDGARTPVEASVVLLDNYADKDARFFMFGFTVENTPLDVQLDHLVRADTGEEMPCFEGKRVENGAVKCFVDLKHMPAAGTEIRMTGSVGSSKVGSFQVGAIVVPFTYTWARIQMENGLNAELYGYTVVTVKTPTSGDGKLGGIGNSVPGVGALGVVAGGVVAVGLAALRNRRRA